MAIDVCRVIDAHDPDNSEVFSAATVNALWSMHVIDFDRQETVGGAEVYWYKRGGCAS